MEAELIADKALFTGKKRYAMRKVWDEGDNIIHKPKMKIRGFEIVRNSTPHWVREKLRECITVIFETESNEKLLDFIEECREEFKHIGFAKQAFPRGVNFKRYTMDSSGLPIAVRAAFKFNEAIKTLKLDGKYQPIGDGSKIRFAYIKTPNVLHSNVIGCITKMPPELSELFEVDVPLQFQKAFIEPIKGITEAIEWTHERKNDLSEFFS
jgi:DNA polymerase elongation subunit (family B)